MLAIFKREFKAYFQSIIGWLFIAVTLCLYSLYFVVYNLVSGYAYVSYCLSAISFIFLITVPVLTMRILAEERNRKTDQLILTAPVSVEKVVAAKFLAMAAIFSISMAVIALSPLFLRIFGTVPLGESYTAIFGFWLYGMTCIAVGMFVSSLTESQVIAAVVSFGFLFIGYMMGSLTNLISSEGNILTKILGCYDLTSHLDNFCSGELDLTGVVYYVTVTFLFLFLTVQSIQKRRWSMSTKKIKLGVFSTGMIVVGVAVVVFVNLVVDALPSTITSIDATSEKLYTITDDTKGVLANLDEDVTIYVLSSKSSLDTADATLAKTLEHYADASSHVKVEYKDPKVYPQFASNYTSDSLTSNSLIIESGKRSKVIAYSDLYESSVDYTTYSSTTTGYDGEGQITSAIQYVMNDNMPVVYEIAGHDETALSGKFTDAISKANIELTSLTLITCDAIPDDAAGIIINGPTSDFSADDAQKVIDYLAAGGKAFITATYAESDLPNFESILSQYGLTLQSGLVVEGDSSHCTSQSPFYLLPDIAYSTWTSAVSDGYVFVPYAKGITYPESTDDSTVTITDLFTTSDSAFSKTDVANMTSYDKADGDVDGPFTIGLEVEDAVDDDTTTQLFVFGSSTMFTDSADEMVSGNNASVFSSCIASFTSDDESADAVVVPVKEYDSASVTVSSTVVVASAVMLIVVLPLALVVIGISIWAIRRKK